MNAERFVELSDIYGGDIGRWPSALQPEAQACLSANPVLETTLRDARDLDDLLHFDDTAFSTDRLRQRISSAISSRQRAWERKIAWVSALVGIAVLGVGAAAGGALAPLAPSSLTSPGPGAPSASDEQTSFGRLIAEEPGPGKAVRS